MGRAPCCDKANVKRGPWSPEEDSKLKEFIEKYGTGGNWIALPQKAGLKRCGKSCRLRWLNYLRPNIKHGEFSNDEDRVICTLYSSIGSRWSIIASHLPGRTDNDIKNYWNTKLKKKIMGVAPSQKKQHQNSRHQLQQHQPQHYLMSPLQSALAPPTPSPTSAFPSHISFSSNAPKLVNSSPLSIDGGFLLPQEVFGSIAHAGLDNGCHAIQQDGAGCGSTGTVLVFGGDHPSCSSSRELEYGVYSSTSSGIGFGPRVGMECLTYSDGGCGTGFIENEKILFHDHVAGGGHASGARDMERGNHTAEGMWVDTQLDYGYEEIKQLVSSDPVNPDGCSNRFFFADDTGGSGGAMIRTDDKSQGRALYQA